MISNHSNPLETCTTSLRLDSPSIYSHSKLLLFFLHFFLNGLLIMAIHLIRKLLPYLTSTTNYTTTTIPCTDLCDPTCADNFDECYTFPATSASLPPLPPPLPPTTTIVATPSTSNDGFHLPPLVILVIIVLASLFLLVSYYAIVIKYCTFWTRLITRRDHRREMSQPDQSPDHHPQITEDHHPHMAANLFDPVVDHPIWLISTVGLHQSVINSITVIRYKKEEGIIDGTDCSVCLSEFQEGETLRLLPKCSHAFHIDCIDTWLRSHTNCPLCRASIVVNTGIGSTEPSFGHSRRTEFTQIADSDSSDVELGSTQTGNGNNVISSMLGENRGETGNYEVDQDQNKVEIDVNNPNSIVRRSYSMDYRNGNSSNSEQNSRSNTSSYSFMGSSSSRPQPQPPQRVRIMKRSYSWSERVFWSARNQNNRNSDISP